MTKKTNELLKDKVMQEQARYAAEAGVTVEKLAGHETEVLMVLALAGAAEHFQGTTDEVLEAFKELLKAENEKLAAAN